MSSYLDEHGQPRPERRQKTGLRAVFDDAYRMVEPFFDPATGWGGNSLEHLAFRVLRENFPQLAVDEVRVVIAAAHRVYIARNPGGSGHLRRPEELRRGQ